MQAVRVNARPGTQVGLAENATLFVPVTEEKSHLEIIGSPLDFVGLNVYTPEYVRADESAAGYTIPPRPSSFPHMPSPWLFVGPEVIYWAVRNVSTLWKPKELYITENGCSADDVVTKDGRINDTDRLMYLRNHLTHLQRAESEGYPVKGYFLWSLLDNFEWADGYSKRFGIHYVDFKTQKRTPKLSAEWYKATIAANAVARNRAVITSIIELPADFRHGLNNQTYFRGRSVHGCTGLRRLAEAGVAVCRVIGRRRGNSLFPPIASFGRGFLRLAEQRQAGKVWRP